MELVLNLSNHLIGIGPKLEGNTLHSKASLFLGVFTKLANLPNLKSEIYIYIYIYKIIEKGELYPKYELEITYESRKLDSSSKLFEG